MKMTKPKILKILNNGMIAGILVSALSFIVPLIPCKKEQGLSLCKLPNPTSNLPDSLPKFYNISTNPLTGLVFQFIIVLIVFSLLFLLLKRKESKILDLTKNKGG